MKKTTGKILISSISGRGINVFVIACSNLSDIHQPRSA